MLILRILLAFSLVSVLSSTEARAASPLVYTQTAVTRVVQELLPKKFDGFAVDTADASMRRKMLRAYPSKEAELHFLYKQSAGAFHVPPQKRADSSARHACFVFFTTRNNVAHARIKTKTGLNDTKVMRLVLAHEVNHCVLHDIMSASLDSLRTSGHTSPMAWFPVSLHNKLRNAALGTVSISEQDLAQSKLQRWTESLTDMFAISTLWQDGSVTSADIQAYLTFRTSDALLDPEHATAGGLRKVYVMLLALEQHPIAAKAYRSMPTTQQHKVLLDMLTEEAATW